MHAIISKSPFTRHFISTLLLTLFSTSLAQATTRTEDVWVTNNSDKLPVAFGRLDSRDPHVLTLNVNADTGQIVSWSEIATAGASIWTKQANATAPNPTHTYKVLQADGDFDDSGHAVLIRGQVTVDPGGAGGGGNPEFEVSVITVDIVDSGAQPDKEAPGDNSYPNGTYGVVLGYESRVNLPPPNPPTYPPIIKSFKVRVNTNVTGTLGFIATGDTLWASFTSSGTYARLATKPNIPIGESEHTIYYYAGFNYATQTSPADEGPETIAVTFGSQGEVARDDLHINFDHCTTVVASLTAKENLPIPQLNVATDDSSGIETPLKTLIVRQAPGEFVDILATPENNTSTAAWTISKVSGSLDFSGSPGTTSAQVARDTAGDIIVQVKGCPNSLAHHQVRIIVLFNLTVADGWAPSQEVTHSGEPDPPPSLTVYKPPVEDRAISVEIDGGPDFGNRVLYNVTGSWPSANPLSGNFSGDVFLNPIPPTAIPHTVRAGYDLDGDGYLVSSEITHQIIVLLDDETIGMIKEVGFSGPNQHDLRNDYDTQDFGAPQWKDNSPTPNGNTEDNFDINYPVCLVRNKTVDAYVVIHLPDGDPGTAVKVRGYGPDSMTTPIANATVNPIGMAAEAIATLTFTTPNKIRYYEAMDFYWEVSIDNGANWRPVGVSENQAYVIWDTPTSISKLTWTLVHSGTVAADGLVSNDAAAVFAKIWTAFQTKNIVRASDGAKLTYWGYVDSNNNNSYDDGEQLRMVPATCPWTDYPSMIKNKHGQCHAFMNFAEAMLRAQGITHINGQRIKYVELTPKPGPDPIHPFYAFAIKNWALGDNGAGPHALLSGVGGFNVNFSIPGPGQAANAAGVSGQGNSPHPPSSFQNHFILKIDGKYYDPSYGIGGFTNRLQYEAAALAGRIKNAANGQKMLYKLVENASDEICNYSESTREEDIDNGKAWP